MNWKSKLESLGLNETSVSRSLQKKIKDFYLVQEGISEAKEALNDADDDDAEEITSQIESLKEKLAIINDQIIRSAELYIKNKDVNELKIQRLRDAKELKKSGKTAESKASQSPAPATTVAEPVKAVVIEEKKEEKKSTNGFLWVLGIAATAIVAVVTLGKVRE